VGVAIEASQQVGDDCLKGRLLVDDQRHGSIVGVLGGMLLGSEVVDGRGQRVVTVLGGMLLLDVSLVDGRRG
jgi:uncharacterized protein YcfJ